MHFFQVRSFSIILKGKVNNHEQLNVVIRGPLLKCFIKSPPIKLMSPVNI